MEARPTKYRRSTSTIRHIKFFSRYLGQDRPVLDNLAKEIDAAWSMLQESPGPDAEQAASDVVADLAVGLLPAPWAEMFFPGHNCTWQRRRSDCGNHARGKRHGPRISFCLSAFPNRFQLAGASAASSTSHSTPEHFTTRGMWRFCAAAPTTLLIPARSDMYSTRSFFAHCDGASPIERSS